MNLCLSNYTIENTIKNMNKNKRDLVCERNKHEPKLLNLKEISKIYSIPLSTLRRWASERRFPIYKISNRILISIEEFEEWLNEQKINRYNSRRLEYA